MAEFKFNCPQCGQTIEADESFRGQTAECPYCGKGIVVPRGATKSVGRLTATRPSAAMSASTTTKPTRNAQLVQVRCPHCGTAYETEHSEYGKMARCSNCGNDFTVGMVSPVKRGLRRFFSCKGRARRGEFLLCSLFLPVPLLGLFVGVTGCVRRLHDLNKSEWWLLSLIASGITARLIGMAPVSAFAVFILLAWIIILGSLDGTSGDNDYGPDPQGRIGTGEKTPAAAIAIPILTVITVVGTLITILVNFLTSDLQQSEAIDRQTQSAPAVQQETIGSQKQESILENSADRQVRTSHENIDMVTVDGVIIRRLPGDEFEKITDEDGDEMFSAALPKEDGFTPGVNIQSLPVDLDILSGIPGMPSNISQQMKKVKAQDMKVFMDNAIPMLMIGIKAEFKDQGVHADITISKRTDNTVTFLVGTETEYEYQKFIFDARNTRWVVVTGVWKLNKDKKTIIACVDSAHLVGQ